MTVYFGGDPTPREFPTDGGAEVEVCAEDAERLRDYLAQHSVGGARTTAPLRGRAIARAGRSARHMHPGGD